MRKLLFIGVLCATACATAEKARMEQNPAENQPIAAVANHQGDKPERKRWEGIFGLTYHKKVPVVVFLDTEVRQNNPPLGEAIVREGTMVNKQYRFAVPAHLYHVFGFEELRVEKGRVLYAAQNGGCVELYQADAMSTNEVAPYNRLASRFQGSWYWIKEGTKPSPMKREGDCAGTQAARGGE